MKLWSSQESGEDAGKIEMKGRQEKKKISFTECTFRISPDPEGLGKLLSNKIIVTDYRHSSFNIPSP